MKKIILMSALPVLAMAAPQMASAQDQAANTRISHAVEVSDLDLGSEEGQAALDSRLRTAAGKVCSKMLHGTRSITGQANCVRATLEKSEGQIARVVNQARYGG